MEKILNFKGLEGSIAKEITFGNVTRKKDFTDGVYTAFVSSLDGKRCSDFNYQHILRKVEFGENGVGIRKTTKGYMIISLDDFQKLMDYLEKSETYIHGGAKRYFRMTDRKYQVRRENYLKKIKKVNIEEVVRNLSKTKELSVLLNTTLDATRVLYIDKFTEYNLKDLAAKMKDLDMNKSFEENCLKGIHGRGKYIYLEATKRLNILRKYITQSFVDGLCTLTLKDNYKEIAKNIATDDVDNMINMFISKNCLKIGSIFYIKQKVSKIEILNITSSAKGFDGNISVEFEDGASFVAKSQTVFAEGFIQSAHYRYPTTFHDVKSSDGKFVKKMSELDMIKKFK